MKTIQVFFFTILICCSFVMENGYSQCFVDTVKLNETYRDLITNPKTYERERAFFDAFPSSWMEFYMTYQYYYQGKTIFLDSKQIEVFGNLSLIPDSTYCDKVIQLAIGGKWSADYTSAFQKVLHEIMSNKTDALFSRLSKQTKGYRLRFWLFYWSSPFLPEDGGSVRKDFPIECEKLKSKMKAKYPDEVKTMEIALPYALGEYTWGFFDEDFPHHYFVK